MADTTNLYDFEPPKGSGNFFSLEDGQSARIRIMSAPYVFEGHFPQPSGEDKLSLRFAWLIYNFEEATAQVLKQSGTFFSTLGALTKDPDFGSDPTKHDIRVTRAGKGTDTKYALNLTKTDNEITTKINEAVAEMNLVKDSNEPTIIPLEQYIAQGRKFETATTASGDVIIKELPAEDAKVDID